MSGLARDLAGAVLDITEPPDDVLGAARLHFLDACGVALAAAATGPASGVTALADGSGPCTVFGTARTASAPLAALANGTLTHSLEYDDTHVGSVMHGSAVIAPAALATAQETKAGGRRMLHAYALGWEILVRLGLAAPGEIQDRGFQGTSAAGPFAAAVTAGILRGVDADVLGHAVGIAGSMAGGTFAFLRDGATVKAAQPAIAAQAGLTAVRLAEAGVTGPGDVFDGPAGFFSLFAGRTDGGARLRELLATLGSRWHLPEAAFKGYPCCHFIHPFIEALDGVPTTDVAAVHCLVPDGQWSVIAEPWDAKRHPAKAHDARWSLPYALAARIVDGSVEARHFQGETRPDLVAVAQRVTAEPWTGSGYPDVFPARLTVRTTTGATHEAHVDDVRGSVRRPFTGEEVVAKFRRNAALAGLPEAVAAAVAAELVDAQVPDLDVFRAAQEERRP